jgi:hypothetical protein
LHGSDENSRPNWSGFLERTTTSTGKVYNKFQVDFLPIIDFNPSDKTCIYSTLRFIKDQTSKFNIFPVITFDQPLGTGVQSYDHYKE